MHQLGAVLLVSLLTACGKTEENEEPMLAGCEPRALPLTGAADAPTLEGLILDCTDSAVELAAIVSDPQGDTDLDDVPQVFRVYRSLDCSSGTLEIVDDVLHSDFPEPFGIVLERSDDPEAYSAICAASRWPVEAELHDASGNTTAGLIWMVR